ncbi:hypothetical protein NP233_g1480 [Leucocoprinus birnbaumii]|uniref:Polysaccharide lyase family 8 protein n=1 Tax=Leucocoprinus birnbaumii TaxID=56174 RepID=A0AAD5W250_9AGAR|nr:hypothetical protein NP233_g1480 [Leucocoprinus birnbaumii]
MRSLLTLTHTLFLHALFFGSSLVLGDSSSVSSSAALTTPSLSTSSSGSGGISSGLPISTTSTPTSSVVSTSPTSAASSSTGSNAAPGNSTSASATSASPSTTGTALPFQSVDPTTLAEIQLMTSRRLSTIVGPLANGSNIQAWLNSLGADGKWPDSEVDYTTGCAARRANWPAQTHWQRILVMAAAWHGGLIGGEQFVNDSALHDKISLAMDYWFGRDLTNLQCLNNGGTASCPCDNPGNLLWNTNWYSNVILIPSLAGQSCLLLNDSLTLTQFDHCLAMTGRSYDLFLQPIKQVSFLTGANILDVAKLGIDGALLNINVTQITDAYRRIHNEVVIHQEVGSDGIRPDGSFGQHGGLLYNGNYGYVFSNDVLDLEISAAQTQFAAPPDSQSAFASLFDGDRWMLFRNTLTQVLHWDFSTLPRFITFPVADGQPSASINMNLTEVGVLGQLWNSSILSDFATLSGQGKTSNAGDLVGNRMFWDNDYMVHRGRNYVSTLKMLSTRTQNSECTNTQNPFSFHLADGTHYTYIKGNEYEDIAASWDWNLIPGITTDYGGTNLSCGQAAAHGVETFVGGVTTGEIGIAVMRYTNPLTKALHWQKTWFFLDDDVQYTMVANLSVTSGKPVYSVLDQRRHDGAIFVGEGIVGDDGDSLDGLFGGGGSGSGSGSGTVEQLPSGPLNQTIFSPNSLWHGDVGYVFNTLSDDDSLHVITGEKTGNWSLIGTSTQPPTTVDLFTAYIEHGTADLNNSISYTMFPGTQYHEFTYKQSQTNIQEVSNDADVSAIFDERHRTAMVVFWNRSGGSVTIESGRFAPVTITANGNAAIVYRFDDAAVYVSDPSQSLSEIEVGLKVGFGRKPSRWGWGMEKSFTIGLPGSGSAGKSVRQDF